MAKATELEYKLAEILADDEQNDKVREHHIRLARRVLRWLEERGVVRRPEEKD